MQQIKSSHFDREDINRITSIPFMYFNARSLSNKIVLLQNYANEIKPKVIALSETWAKPEIPDSIYALSGYNLLRDDRLNKRGGGVMLYVDYTISISQISFGSSHAFEFVVCKLQLTKNDFLGILCIYRPPNITDTGDLELINVLDKFMKLNFSYNIIMGDFNMPAVNCKRFKAPTKLIPFVQCCTKYVLSQHVKESTRPNSNSLLDLIFSTIGTSISEVSVEECFGSSDHSIINFIVELPFSNKMANHYIFKRNYYKADWKVFMRDSVRQSGILFLVMIT